MLASASDSSSGLIEMISAMGTTTVTSFVPTNSPAYTSTISASGYQSGTIVIGEESAGYTTTTVTSGGSMFTTTLFTATDNQQGTIEYVSALGTWCFSFEKNYGTDSIRNLDIYHIYPFNSIELCFNILCCRHVIGSCRGWCSISRSKQFKRS